MLDSFITGLGISALTRTADRTVSDIAVEAALLAIEDAHLDRGDVDGLLISHSPVESCEPLGLSLHEYLGLGDLQLLQDIHGEGSSAMQSLHNAAMYVSAGLAQHVLCVWADAPVRSGQSSGAAYNVTVPHGMVEGWEAAHGLFGGASAYALCARRHMARYGTTVEHLGAVAIAARTWAAGNPRAMLRSPLTMEEHHASPLIADPFRQLDCAFPVNGGAAFVVSSDSAGGGSSRRVRIAGIGQGHRANYHYAGAEIEVDTSAGVAAGQALRMAGFELQDVDVCELYDCFSYSTIVLLEDLGFCEKGRGGDFVLDGNILPGGTIPTNTGGGQLSGHYLQGMTPLCEAIIQIRGDGGDRQVPDAQVALVHGHGGVFNLHACTVLTA
jgi:acetyl-CoA acetyltransferase